MELISYKGGCDLHALRNFGLFDKRVQLISIVLLFKTVIPLRNKYCIALLCGLQ